MSFSCMVISMRIGERSAETDYEAEEVLCNEQIRRRSLALLPARNSTNSQNQESAHRPSLRRIHPSAAFSVDLFIFLLQMSDFTISSLQAKSEQEDFNVKQHHWVYIHG